MVQSLVRGVLGIAGTAAMTGYQLGAGREEARGRGRPGAAHRDAALDRG
jgi:hypothetical protein